MIEVCAIPITNLQAFPICTILINKQQQNNNDNIKHLHYYDTSSYFEFLIKKR